MSGQRDGYLGLTRCKCGHPSAYHHRGACHFCKCPGFDQSTDQGLRLQAPFADDGHGYDLWVEKKGAA